MLKKHLFWYDSKSSNIRNPPSQLEFNKMILKIVVAHSLPLSFPDYLYFKQLMRRILPSSLKLPSRKVITNQLLNDYVNVKSKLTQLLQNQSYVSVPFDFWSKNGLSFLGSTAHFLDDKWELTTMLLSLRYVQNKHTAVNIEKWVTECLLKMKLKNFFAIITDNANNMKS